MSLSSACGNSKFMHFYALCLSVVACNQLRINRRWINAWGCVLFCDVLCHVLLSSCFLCRTGVQYQLLARSHTHTHAHTRTYTHTDALTRTHAHAQAGAHDAHVYTHIHAARARTHTHTHTNTHTHTHTHTHTLGWPLVSELCELPSFNHYKYPRPLICAMRLNIGGWKQILQTEEE